MGCDSEGDLFANIYQNISDPSIENLATHFHSNWNQIFVIIFYILVNAGGLDQEWLQKWHCMFFTKLGCKSA